MSCNYTCGLCGKTTDSQFDFRNALFVGRICHKCEEQFQRTPVPNRDVRSTKMRAYLRHIERGIEPAPFKMKIKLFKNNITILSPVELGPTGPVR